MKCGILNQEFEIKKILTNYIFMAKENVKKTDENKSIGLKPGLYIFDWKDPRALKIKEVGVPKVVTKAIANMT